VTTAEPPEERRDEQMQTHVAQVWAESIAGLDPPGLFRLGTACLDAADESTDADRAGLLASVAYSLLVYAGRHEHAVGVEIARLCDREQRARTNRPETARVIAELEISMPPPPALDS
jgi:hypothetical protein